MRVRRLDPLLVDRIAAGEVIERPASAVKELVENALDAGAARIDVAIEAGGRRLIRVIDDGSGMSAEDLALAVERHATSKIPDGDLTAIATLGFRGEALPSIAAVADLTIDARAAGAEVGAQIRVEAGEKRGIKASNWPKGARVEARDLFAATPARLKFLKSERAETAAVADVVKRLAMANAAVRFSFATDAGAGFDYPACGAGEEGRARRVAQALGADFAANSIALRAEREGFSLAGLAGLPTFHRANALMQYVYVNGRPVRGPAVHIDILHQNGAVEGRQAGQPGERGPLPLGPQRESIAKSGASAWATRRARPSPPPAPQARSPRRAREGEAHRGMRQGEALDHIGHGGGLGALGPGGTSRAGVAANRSRASTRAALGTCWP